MRYGRRAELAARAFLTLGTLVPYWRLLTFGVIYITDDYFASDIFNGELPARVLMGRMLRDGQLPVWTTELCSGLPLAGAPADPIGLAAFTLLPAAPALDVLVIVLLLVAAHGAYSLARRSGAGRAGAVLAGVAFAGSGYIACQLKHLAIVSTVVWLPAALVLLDRALAPRSEPEMRRSRRGLAVAAFGLVFAQQALAGFPQSAYICALVYAAFVLFRTVENWRSPRMPRTTIAQLAAIAAAAALGGAAGAVVLLPLARLGAVSDRAGALGYEWATRLAYWPSNILTFLMPYINGDISNNTYIGPPFFWEDYGYVGAATFLLAIYGGVRERRRAVVVFTVAMTIVGYLLVLGRATPVYRIGYLLVPGLSMFRFPTRFLIVVELGLALLAAIGLTRLRADLERRLGPRSVVPQFVALALCVGTMLDLLVYQPRQNPMVAADEWLAPPRTVDVVQADTPQPRTFTPHHRLLHRAAFMVARGWVNVTPYFELREVLEPNTGGGFWNTPSADCYAGISARWYVDLWGDHNREASLLGALAGLDFQAQVLRVHPTLPTLLAAFGVTHLLSLFPAEGVTLPRVGSEAGAYVYRIDGAQRVRFVRRARAVKDDEEAIARLRDPRFDPDGEILLHDAPEVAVTPLGIAAEASGRGVVTRDDSRELVIEADAPADGFLLIADTYYPGWTATVDGRPTPLYRANLAVRGLALPRGQHRVRLTYDPPGFRPGLLISISASVILVVWAAAAAFIDRRAHR